MTPFRDLHVPGDPVILANAWDVGSARMLAALGARAIGTTSAGFAFTRGQRDGGRVTRAESIDHGGLLAGAVAVPVSADLEDGFGPEPADCSETVRLAGVAGLAGCSIEDVDGTGRPYSRAAAVARIETAAIQARECPHDFVLTARADGVMHGAYDLAEAIARIRDFASAGADVVYVPMPQDIDALNRIVAAVDVPVNALAAGRWTQISRAEFAEAGVARISIGSALARATHQLIHDSARAMFEDGNFGPLGALGGCDVDALLEAGTGRGVWAGSDEV